MESNSRVIESISLEKNIIGKVNEKDVIWAQVTRTFSDRKNPSKVVGKLVNTFLCDDCYLEEMADGDFLPVVRNEREMGQSFLLFFEHGAEYWGRVSYYKAREISERQTTFLGRLRNKVELAYLVDFAD